MRIVGWIAAALLALSLAPGPTHGQQFRAEQAPGGDQRRGAQTDPAPSGESAIDSLLQLFSGDRRLRLEGAACNWDSCPPDLQCCCCGDRCVCKKECSFQPCR